jgi:hypothetical protein
MTGGSPNIAPSEPAFRGPGPPAQAERTPIGARRSAGERALRRWRRSCQPQRCFHVASGGRVGSGSDGTHLRPRRPPRRNAHPRLPATSRQAGDAALHRPPLRPSNALLPEVGRWQEEYANRLSIALVSRGDPEDAIASPMAGGAESIRPFVAQAVAAPANVPLLPRAPAPRAAQEGQPCPNCARSAVAEWGLLTPLLTPLRALHAETLGNHQQRNQLR